MSQQTAPSWPAGSAITHQSAAVQRGFTLRVYAWLLTAVVAFIGIEYVIFASGFVNTILELVYNTNWLLVLGGFMVASWVAQRATVARSRGVQIAGLVGLVAAYAFIFTPMIAYAAATDPSLLTLAGGITLVGFIALTGIAVTTAVDFSFMRSLLMWGGVVAIGLIAVAVLFGMELGTWFFVAMIALAGGAVLYDTQRIRNLPQGHEIGAAASLFGSVAMIFYYVLALLSRR